MSRMSKGLNKGFTVPIYIPALLLLRFTDDQVLYNGHFRTSIAEFYL